MERYRPYGWGCMWHDTYCLRYGQDHEEACLKCYRIIGNDEEEKWREYLTMRLNHRRGDITKEEFKQFMEKQVHSSTPKVRKEDDVS